MAPCDRGTEVTMNQFDQLVDFVKQCFPSYAYVLQPGAEIAVDGRIFRTKEAGGLTFHDENGAQDISLTDAQAILEADLQE